MAVTKSPSVRNNCRDDNYQWMNKKRNHHQLDIPAVDLYPQILRSSTRHQAYDKYRYDDIHQQIHQPDSFAAGS